MSHSESDTGNSYCTYYVKVHSILLPTARGSMSPPRLPPGYHFTPSAVELVHGYLDPWIAGQPPLGELGSVVCVADVYGCDPATLTERFREFGHDGQHWYFLCVARWKVRGAAAAGRVMNRAVEGGQRAGQGAAGQHCFQYRDAHGRSTGWLMVEFCNGLAAAAAGVKVICKVYLLSRAPATPPAGEECLHVGTKRLATEERRDEEVVHHRDVSGDSITATLLRRRFRQDGGADALVMVRPNGEVLRFCQPTEAAVLEHNGGMMFSTFSQTKALISASRVL